MVEVLEVVVVQQQQLQHGGESAAFVVAAAPLGAAPVVAAAPLDAGAAAPLEWGPDFVSKSKIKINFFIEICSKKN